MDRTPTVAVGVRAQGTVAGLQGLPRQHAGRGTGPSWTECSQALPINKHGREPVNAIA